MSYYVRATGRNRFAGGTDKWLKIRGVKRNSYGYVLEVRIRGSRRYVTIPGKNQRCENLEFSSGNWPNVKPVSHLRIIETCSDG